MITETEAEAGSKIGNKAVEAQWYHPEIQQTHRSRFGAFPHADGECCSSRWCFASNHLPDCGTWS